MLLFCLLTASLAQDSLIYKDSRGFRGRKGQTTKVCHLFCVQTWPYHFASLSLSFFIYKIGMIKFISGLLLETNEVRVKAPLEFLEYNKCLPSVGSSPVPHGQCFCEKAAWRAIWGLGTRSMYLGWTALGGAIYSRIYAPNRNRIIVVRKMWLSCFYLGKT